MTTATLAVLDQVELLRLALDASRSNNRGAVLSYLKEAVARFDATAAAHYLLGAEYAQLRMLDRAVAEMETAITLDPALSTARLQLGLLLLGTGASQRALLTLQPLVELHADDPLRHFGHGLIHLIREELTHTVASLQQGIALNLANPPLNADMQKIIGEIDKIPPELRQRDADPLPEDASARHIFLSAYTGSRNQ